MVAVRADTRFGGRVFSLWSVFPEPDASGAVVDGESDEAKIERLYVELSELVADAAFLDLTSDVRRRYDELDREVRQLEEREADRLMQELDSKLTMPRDAGRRLANEIAQVLGNDGTSSRAHAAPVGRTDPTP